MSGSMMSLRLIMAGGAHVTVSSIIAIMPGHGDCHQHCHRHHPAHPLIGQYHFIQASYWSELGQHKVHCPGVAHARKSLILTGTSVAGRESHELNITDPPGPLHESISAQLFIRWFNFKFSENHLRSLS